MKLNELGKQKSVTKAEFLAGITLSMQSYILTYVRLKMGIFDRTGFSTAETLLYCYIVTCGQ